MSIIKYIITKNMTIYNISQNEKTLNIEEKNLHAPKRYDA